VVSQFRGLRRRRIKTHLHKNPVCYNMLYRPLGLDRLLGMTFIRAGSHGGMGQGSFLTISFSRTLLEVVVAVVTVVGILATIPCTMFCFLISYLQM
jgi:hypothetical protein